LANVLAKHYIYDVEDVEEEPTMLKRSVVLLVAMAKQQPSGGFLGRPKILTGKESAEKLVLKVIIEVPFVNSDEN